MFLKYDSEGWITYAGLLAVIFVFQNENDSRQVNFGLTKHIFFLARFIRDGVLRYTEAFFRNTSFSTQKRKVLCAC